MLGITRLPRSILRAIANRLNLYLVSVDCRLCWISNCHKKGFLYCLTENMIFTNSGWNKSLQSFQRPFLKGVIVLSKQLSFWDIFRFITSAKSGARYHMKHIFRFSKFVRSPILNFKLIGNLQQIWQMFICDALCNLAPFVQFKKCENMHGGVLLLVNLKAKAKASHMTTRFLLFLSAHYKIPSTT